ncbi:putative reductase/deaminase [Nocardia nova SH22a]|uniref:Putative reductase/deaminase n=1 Tax=Nocardia nova SH22a TaxID=1415166 RepID=W5T7G1_9NOCA|nr:dCMP deaminase [Nocardia nova]AHH14858.1 putative reductase/deaminase [Nocardia nova SH22a]
MTAESEAWRTSESSSRIPGEPGAHRFWMHHAIGLARLCPPSTTAFSVGAVIVGPDGVELTHGYSRETDAKVHAEESALDKLGNDPRLATATLYSTLEPCSARASVGRPPCTERILTAGIPRVVIAWREPGTFVENCVGVERLREHGVEVVEIPDLAAEAMSMNRHLHLS